MHAVSCSPPPSCRGGRCRSLPLAPGPLTPDSFEATSDQSTIHLKRTEGGFEASIDMNGQHLATSTYTKAAKEVSFDAPDAPSSGLPTAMIGTWDVAGSWTIPQM